jgi:CheY-like chemotaxis protein
VARWEEGAIDLIVMDLRMPVMDGLSATRMIRSLEGAAGRTPILALTANVLPEDRRNCLAAGMDGFLRKPIRCEELYQAVATHAGRGKAAGISP